MEIGTNRELEEMHTVKLEAGCRQCFLRETWQLRKEMQSPVEKHQGLLVSNILKFWDQEGNYRLMEAIQRFSLGGKAVLTWQFICFLSLN